MSKGTGSRIVDGATRAELLEAIVAVGAYHMTPIEVVEHAILDMRIDAALQVMRETSAKTAASSREHRANMARFDKATAAYEGAMALRYPGHTDSRKGAR